MKAVALVKYGKSETAFEIIETPIPVFEKDQVLIKVDTFGLNFADVMARQGLYKEAPPLPAILGYEVAGTVEAIGEEVENVKPGDKVVAMTRFGGYAEYAVTPASAVTSIPTGISMSAATALATQYCTAYFAAAEMINLHEGNKVLIHSGAGGVGTALIQYARYKKCEIFSTAGSDEKINYLKTCGVHHPINYNTHNFETEIKRITSGKNVDVIFDAVGGKSVKQGMRCLAAGGRMVCYGAADLTGKNIFGKLKALLSFGIYHPLMLMSPSKSIIGINMLAIGDSNPAMMQRCLQNVVRLTNEGVFKPVVSKLFNVNEIAAAHTFLEKRNSVGKVAVSWTEE